MGASYAYLPDACAYQLIANTTYYQCPNGWLKPAYGANGVYYRVVAAP